MADDSLWGDPEPSRSDRVVVAMTDSRDRQLLVEWLGTVPQYDVAAVADPTALPDAYDLCIVDAHLLQAFAETIRERREATSVPYLPHMLLVPGGTDAQAGEVSATELFDDVVEMPTDQPALRRRIENLLRAQRASRRLQDRRDQYRRLVERTPEPIVLLQERSIAYANEAACELLTVDIDDVMGAAFTSFVEADDHPALEYLLEEVAAAERRSEFVEMRLVAASDTAIPAEVTAVTVTYEDEQATQLVMRDLSEQVRREQRLTLFERAIEAASQGITIADAQQDDVPIVYANEAFERITGYSISEVLGRDWRFLQGENTDEETVATIRDAIEAQRPVSVELLNYRRDGTAFWNRLDIVPVYDEEGTATHFLGLQRDVTERKEREQRLVVLDRVLRHNLRNRLTVIRGNAEELLETTGRDAAHRILEAVDELLAISEQVRSFRGTISPSADRYETLDLVRVVERAVETLEKRHADADITLDLPDSAEIQSHNTLALAVENLLTLATDGPDCRLEVRIDCGDEHVTMTVTDLAQSLSVDALDIVASGAETPLAHPRGLELWLIRWATEHSGGEFSVDLEEDRSVVQLELFRPESEHPV